MTRDVALGPGAEFDAIRALRARWDTIAVGIGDDAAVIVPPRGDSLVVSVDTSVENVHFKAQWLSPREIGYRAVAAALSDLAAMGAKPLGVLVAITLPDAWRDRLMDLGDGIADAVRTAGTTLRGGNMTAGHELSITTTVLGDAFAPLARSGARPGNHVYVTGRLGGPATAIKLLSNGASLGELPLDVAERFRRPIPRIEEARWLADRGATAAVDVSDGLIADLRHVATASGVVIGVAAASVPVVDGAALDAALEGGEEYELALTAPPGVDSGEFEARFGVPLTDIGTVLAADGDAGSVLIGERVASQSGYDHLSR